VSGIGSGPALIGDSPLARCNPVVKLVALTAISLGLLLVLDPVTPSVLYALAIPSVIAASRLRVTTLVRAQVPFAVFAVGLLAVNAVTRPGDPVARLGPLTVTAQGLSVGGSIAVRVLLIGVLSLAFLGSTDPTRLMTSLRMQLGVSPRFAYALLAGHRLLQDLPREWALLRSAHHVRAPLNRRGRPRHPVRRWTRCAFGLLVVCIRRGEQLAQALESRGLGLEPRTCWQPEGLSRRDAILTGAIATAIAGALLVSAAWGTLRGVDALFG
jgi:energy-coupling factor transport system permease protein